MEHSKILLGIYGTPLVPYPNLGTRYASPNLIYSPKYLQRNLATECLENLFRDLNEKGRIGKVSLNDSLSSLIPRITLCSLVSLKYTYPL